MSGREKFLTTHHERDQETDLDYRGARFYDSDIGRFLSLDPLAAKYPSLSDYSYVAGNPIYFIDADGRRIIIPRNKYYAQTIKDLAIIYSTRKGRKLINDLAKSDTDIVIMGGALVVSGVFVLGSGYFPLTNNIRYMHEGQHVGGVYNPTWVLLGHELKHAHDDIVLKRKSTDTAKESRAVLFENYLRDVLFPPGSIYKGATHRLRHGGDVLFSRRAKGFSSYRSYGEQVDINSIKIKRTVVDEQDFPYDNIDEWFLDKYFQTNIEWKDQKGRKYEEEIKLDRA